jgi:hypothetical protein
VAGPAAVRSNGVGCSWAPTRTGGDPAPLDSYGSRDHGHLVLTPLILTQPSGLQGTAAKCVQTRLGMEEAEAMDMERD